MKKLLLLAVMLCGVLSLTAAERTVKFVNKLDEPLTLKKVYFDDDEGNDIDLTTSGVKLPVKIAAGASRDIRISVPSRAVSEDLCFYAEIEHETFSEFDAEDILSAGKVNTVEFYLDENDESCVKMK